MFFLRLKLTRVLPLLILLLPLFYAYCRLQRGYLVVLPIELLLQFTLAFGFLFQFGLQLFVPFSEIGHCFLQTHLFLRPYLVIFVLLLLLNVLPDIFDDLNKSLLAVLQSFYQLLLLVEIFLQGKVAFGLFNLYRQLFLKLIIPQGVDSHGFHLLERIYELAFM